MAKPTPKKTAQRKAIGTRAKAAKTARAKSAPASRTLVSPRRKSVKPKTEVRKMRPAAEVKMKESASKPSIPSGSNGTPRPAGKVKNQAGLKPKELEFFRQLLLAKRRELLGDVSSMEEEALRSNGASNLSNLPIHMADMGTDNYEQEFTLNLVQKDREVLQEIHAALRKIQDGTYGICEGTGKPISKARLEAKPWARHSIEHARQMEKGPFRR